MVYRPKEKRLRTDKVNLTTYHHVFSGSTKSESSTGEVKIKRE